MDFPVLIPLLGEYRPSTMPTKFILSTNESVSVVLSRDYLKRYIPISFGKYDQANPTQYPQPVPLNMPLIAGDFVDVLSMGSADGDYSFGAIVRVDDYQNTYSLEPITDFIFNVGTESQLKCNQLRKSLNLVAGGSAENNYRGISQSIVKAIGISISQDRLNDFLLGFNQPGFAFSYRISFQVNNLPVFSTTINREDTTPYMYFPINPNLFITTDGLGVSINCNEVPVNIPANAASSDIWVSS